MKLLMKYTNFLKTIVGLLEGIKHFLYIAPFNKEGEKKERLKKVGLCVCASDGGLFCCSVVLRGLEGLLDLGETILSVQRKAVTPKTECYS